MLSMTSCHRESNNKWLIVIAVVLTLVVTHNYCFKYYLTLLLFLNSGRETGSVEG